MSAIPDDLDYRLREVELHTHKNGDRISSHEDLCAERYKNINDTLAAIKTILFWVGGALILGMAGVLVHQVFP